jgi:hypothetical protein
MKSPVIQFFAFVAVILSSSQVTNAWASDPSSASFLESVQQLVRSCVVRPYSVTDGKKTYGFLKSRCSNVQTHGAWAEFSLGNTKYVASLEESLDSDGGDLDNIDIKDLNGAVVAHLSNVLAFGDILLGLAGANVELPELYDQSTVSE